MEMRLESPLLPILDHTLTCCSPCAAPMKVAVDRPERLCRPWGRFRNFGFEVRTHECLEYAAQANGIYRHRHRPLAVTIPHSRNLLNVWISRPLCSLSGWSLSRAPGHPGCAWELDLKVSGFALPAVIVPAPRWPVQSSGDHLLAPRSCVRSPAKLTWKVRKIFTANHHLSCPAQGAGSLSDAEPPSRTALLWLVATRQGLDPADP